MLKQARRTKRAFAPGTFHRRGGAVLETCLLMPILIMLGFGIVDYGYCIYLANVFQGAAQAGARAAIPNSGVNSSVTAAVSAMLSPSGISSSKYTVTTSPSSISGSAAGTSITVTVSTTWGTAGTNILSTTFGGISSGKQIQGVATMQREQ